jgi:6-phosphogluconolactonase
MAKAVFVYAVMTMCILLSGCDSDGGGGHHRKTFVFVMSNSAAGNEILAFEDDAGTLVFQANYATGGTGTGTTEVSTATPQDGIDPLASQGSLRVSRDRKWLFAVNAGSDDVTSFRIDNGALTMIDVEPSGGLQPNSLDNFANVIYVSNVGDPSNGFMSSIAGFFVASDGTLSAIPGATYSLSTPTAQPSSVAFSVDGVWLAISELTTNNLSLFPVNMDGTLGSPVTTPSNGPGPFGSTFLSSGSLLVTEAAPMASGALSSYTVNGAGNLTAVSGTVQTSQMATCWVAVTPNERFAFTSNTASGTLSSYQLVVVNQLMLMQAVASTLEGAGSGPIDSGISRNGKRLYVLDGAIGAITTLDIANDGSLTRLGATTNAGLPMLGAQGLAVF